MDTTELSHILVSVFTISLAFTMFALHNFWIALFTVGLAFLIHELAHRHIARSLGWHSEYRLWTPGLIASLGFALATEGNFIFAAPGATVISGKRSVTP